MKKMNAVGFAEELRKRRSAKTAEIPETDLEKKNLFSESCLGLCVE